METTILGLYRELWGSEEWTLHGQGHITVIFIVSFCTSSTNSVTIQ